MSSETSTPNLILMRGLFTTLDRSRPTVNAVAIKDGKFLAVGRDEDVMRLAQGSVPSPVFCRTRLGPVVARLGPSVMSAVRPLSVDKRTITAYLAPFSALRMAPKKSSREQDGDISRLDTIPRLAQLGLGSQR